MFVAVVMTKDGLSRKPLGDFASFVNKDKDAAIQSALAAVDRWNPGRAGRGYYVAVAELTERVVIRKKYKLLQMEHVDG